MMMGFRGTHRHGQTTLNSLAAGVTTLVSSASTATVREFLSGMCGGVDVATTLTIRRGTSAGSSVPVFGLSLAAADNFCFKASPDLEDYLCYGEAGENLYVQSSAAVGVPIVFHTFEQ